MGTSSNLPQPPRFGASQQTGPSSISEWVSFYRWLFSLWRKAANSTDVPQSIALQPPEASGLSADAAIGAAQAFSSERIPIEASRELDGAGINALAPGDRGRLNPDQLLQPGDRGRPAPDQRPASQLGIKTPGEDLSALVYSSLGKQSTSKPPQAPVIEDTHANRVNYSPADYPNFLYWETDRHVYYLSTGANWIYSAGVYTDVIANIPTGLGANDTGFLFAASDYEHLFLWGGSSFNFAPGDPGNQYIVAGGANPPAGGLWAACDGTSTTVAGGNGSTFGVTTPDLTGEVFIKGTNAYTGTQQLASNGQMVPGSTTDNEASHTHSITAGTGSLCTGGAGCTATPIDTVPAATGPGSAHDHGLSTAGTLAPSEGHGGLPLRIGLTWWIRR